MRTTRLLFDNIETAESIARRIVRAFDPGESFCVKGKFFKVSKVRTAHEISRDNIEADKYTLVLNLGEPAPTVEIPKVIEPGTPPRTISEPPPSAVNDIQVSPEETVPKNEEIKVVRSDSTQDTGNLHYRAGVPEYVGKVPIRTDLVPLPPDQQRARVSRESLPKILPLAGQRWQTKDSRRTDSPPFTIARVDEDFVYTDKGGRIALKRWSKYRLVEDDVAAQLSG